MKKKTSLVNDKMYHKPLTLPYKGNHNRIFKVLKKEE